MELKVDLPSLAGQDIDPDTFQRVWNRVMPDQTAPAAREEPVPGIPDTAIPVEPSTGGPPAGGGAAPCRARAAPGARLSGGAGLPGMPLLPRVSGLSRVSRPAGHPGRGSGA